MDTNPRSSNRPRRNRQRLTPAVIARRQRELAAFELRVEGHTLESIAEQLGLANRGVASKYVRRVMERNESDSVQEMRMIRGLQLETIAYKLWPLMNRPRPSLPALDRWLKVQDERFKLFGADGPCCSCGKNLPPKAKAILPPKANASGLPLIVPDYPASRRRG